jgi:hypothetical protein
VVLFVPGVEFEINVDNMTSHRTGVADAVTPSVDTRIFFRSMPNWAGLMTHSTVLAVAAARAVGVAPTPVV